MAAQVRDTRGRAAVPKTPHGAFPRARARARAAVLTPSDLGTAAGRSQSGPAPGEVVQEPWGAVRGGGR